MSFSTQLVVESECLFDCNHENKSVEQLLQLLSFIVVKKVAALRQQSREYS